MRLALSNSLPVKKPLRNNARVRITIVPLKQLARHLQFPRNFGVMRDVTPIHRTN